MSGSQIYDGSTLVRSEGLATNLLPNNESVGLMNASATVANRNVGVDKPISGLQLVDGSGSASNYRLGTAVVTIEKATVTLGVPDVQKAYDGNLSAPSAVLNVSGIGNGDNLLSGSINFTDKNAGDNKTVNIAGFSINDGNNGNNYNAIVYVANTHSSITPRALMVSATGNTRVYDGNAVATVTLGSDKVAGDVLMLVNDTASFNDKNVGTGKTIAVGGINVSGTDAGNYSYNTTASANANLTPRALTATANIDSRTFNNQAYSGGNGVSYSGFVAGDGATDVGGTLVWSGSSQGATQVGNYVITPGGLQSVSGNYALSLASGSLAINAAPPVTFASVFAPPPTAVFGKVLGLIWRLLPSLNFTGLTSVLNVNDPALEPFSRTIPTGFTLPEAP